MSEENPWSYFTPGDTYIYPYGAVCEIQPNFVDEQKRNVSWILASLAQFGRLIEQGDVVLQQLPEGGIIPGIEQVQRLTRLSMDALLRTDFTEFGALLRKYNNKKRVVLPLDILPDITAQALPGSLPDLTTFEEIIFFCKVNEPSQWVVLLARVLPGPSDQERRIDVQGFFVGGASIGGARTVQKRVHRTLALSFIQSTITWRERLHVPLMFAKDNVFLTFLLINYLQQFLL